jgi:hypothetical protein
MADMWSNSANHLSNGCWHTNVEGVFDNGTTAKRTSNRGALTSIRPKKLEEDRDKVWNM